MDSQQPINFDRLRDDDLSILTRDAELDILDSFESILGANADRDVDQMVAEFMPQLLVSVPSEDVTGYGRQGWSFSPSWAIVRIAGMIPCHHKGQEVLLKTLQRLGDSGPEWEDLGYFGLAVREAWNDSPVFELDNVDPDDDGTRFTFCEWENMNSFIAKLYKTDIIGWANLGLWEIRLGLEGDRHEDEDEVPSDVLATRVRVACQWLRLCSERMLYESLLKTGAVKPRGSDIWATGPRFKGPKGYNLERWSFWNRRLTELSRDADDSLGRVIKEAMDAMASAEKNLAKKCPRYKTTRVKEDE